MTAGRRTARGPAGDGPGGARPRHGAASDTEAVPDDRFDLRLGLPAVATWAGALAGTGSARWGLAVALAAAGVALAVGLRERQARRTVMRRRSPPAPYRPVTRSWVAVAALLCLAAGSAAAALRAVALDEGPVAELSHQRAVVSATGSVRTDPRRSTSAAGPGLAREFVTFRLQLDEVTARGSSTRVSTPVLAVADRTWAQVLPGTAVRIVGRLAPPDLGGPIAGVVRIRGSPVVLSGPGVLERATEPFRAALRDAVSGLPDGPRGLVPALVVGDEGRLPDSLQADFQDTGLTHLTAVSGANVAIMLAFVTGLARWVGVRGFALPVLGGLSVLAFVALARPEPSVLRAAAMGIVAVAGLTAGGRRRGVPALGTAVVVLLLVDPWLARSYGFALSVLATAAILLLAPGWRDALAGWLPRPVAEAVAVPLAAQVACTPLVAVLSGAVSLAALPANLLAGIAVAPATVLGLVAAVIGPVWSAPATWAGVLAGAPAAWIVTVAERGAVLPGATVPWAAAGARVVVLVAFCVAAVLGMPGLLRRPASSLAAGGVLVVVLLRPLPHPGWPPDRWVLVACDVGQGDALVVRTGPGSGVVVDAGPDEQLVDRCLSELGVQVVPAVVLTHDHADHVDGLAGVLRGRQVGEVLVGPLDDPPAQVAALRRTAAAAHVPVVVARAGERRGVGEASWEVLWPRWLPTQGSRPNNASLVLRVEVDGVRLLLTGDVEPEAQRALLSAGTETLRADVLKVPHHGSSHQEAGFLRAVGARLALVSVGAGNDYGHPSASTLALLAGTGAVVARTDQDGSLAVVATADGGIELVRSGSAAVAAPP